jgi:hypothetical protein
MPFVNSLKFEFVKKVTIVAIAIVVSCLTSFAAVQHADKSLSDTTKSKSAKVQYTCTMHPEVLSDKPGKCPKCGMTLVKKEIPKKKSTKMSK